MAPRPMKWRPIMRAARGVGGTRIVPPDLGLVVREVGGLGGDGLEGLQRVG